jgi:hypothetical protein
LTASKEEESKGLMGTPRSSCQGLDYSYLEGCKALSSDRVVGKFNPLRQVRYCPTGGEVLFSFAE